MKRAAIYARISRDRLGDEAGVTRQLADCRAEAARRGWEVVEEYVDNDLSAYSGKHRPAYQRMLDDLRHGDVDAVIVYHLDRLTRRPVELEEFLSVCDRAGVKDLATVHGDVDVGTGDGLLIARIMAAVAANESAAKARRVSRKARANAEEGKPHHTARRPFGYETDGMTVIEPEAAVIRDLCARFLAGESIASLVRWLNDSDIVTSTGQDHWNRSTVRNLLRSARNAGLREYHGEVIGPAQWPAIIDHDTHTKLRQKLDDPARRTSRGSRRYLLAGMLRCGKCGKPMYSRPRDGRGRYICRSDPSIGGCGGVFITGAPLDELISEAVLMRLDTPALRDSLAGRQRQTADTAQLADAIEADERQLTELAELWAAKEITVDEWRAARKPIEQRIRSGRRRLTQLTDTGTLSDLVGRGETLRQSWAQLNLDRQRAIVAAVLDHAVIHPSGRTGLHAIDPNRVKPVWRL